MIPATTSKRLLNETNLMILSSDNKIVHSNLGMINDYLQANDLLVVNHSATLPSSFLGHVERTNEFIEFRLAAFQGPSPVLTV